MPILNGFEIKLRNVVSDEAEVPEGDLSKETSRSKQGIVMSGACSMPLFTQAKIVEINKIAAQRMLKACQEAQFIQASGGKITTPAWWW